jgi:Reverse transcriptase (RNA-dependent DNA polymerase)
MLAEGVISYFTVHKAIDPQLYQEDLLLKGLEVDPVLVKEAANPDTLYLREAMSDAQFKEAMKKEVSKHTRKGHWEINQRTEGPSHSKILLAVWSETRIESREVSKHKARLNPRGHKQEYGRYSKTYSQVVKWTSIQLMIILSVVSGWSTQQLDLLMGYSQADISTNPCILRFPRDLSLGGAEIPTVCMYSKTSMAKMMTMKTCALWRKILECSPSVIWPTGPWQQNSSLLF